MPKSKLRGVVAIMTVLILGVALVATGCGGGGSSSGTGDTLQSTTGSLTVRLAQEAVGIEVQGQDVTIQSSTSAALLRVALYPDIGSFPDRTGEVSVSSSLTPAITSQFPIEGRSLFVVSGIPVG